MHVCSFVRIPGAIFCGTVMDYNTQAPQFAVSCYPFICQEEDEGIDLGLSLRSSLQQETYPPSRFLSPPEYGELMGLALLKPCSNSVPRKVSEDEDDETEGAQSKERWCYVKVNMEGVIIGRKICIWDHAGYSTLAHELEQMFGKHSASGLRLFEEQSGFSLFYQDRNENWRLAGDVPWKEFVESVKRLRVARKR